MPEAALRRALGGVCAAFGLLHLAPAAYVWLSSLGPVPVLIRARAWSLFFYVHFIALVVAGYGLLAVSSVRTRVFHGGPMIDFSIGAVGFMTLESVCAAGLRAASWPALIPGAALAVFGLRLMGGRPLLDPKGL
ncbi:MAG: hypothetical protein KGM24_01025 [Elusimicrobia bacterium]|nr:hypothetical protein [Elusimicrobiota bacterium]